MSTIFARPTLYRGILMRSRLEAAWAEQFDTLGWQWGYEPICLAGPDGQYLPDFVVKVPFRAAPLVVEVKGAWWEDAIARGLDYETLYQSMFDECSLWSNLVADWNRRATYIMAVQRPDGGGHRLDVWNKPSFMSQACATICICPEGCQGIVAFARRECIHGHPWMDIELVPSLHGQWWPRRDAPHYDELGLF